MYQLSHLQTTSHLNWWLIWLFILMNVFIWAFLKHLLEVDNKFLYKFYVIFNIVFFGIFFWANECSNPFTKQTVNTHSTELISAKIDVSKEYPYCITLANTSELDKPTYIFLFKDSKSAKQTQTYLNSVMTNHKSNKTAIITPNKNTVMLSCSNKRIGNTGLLFSIFTVKNYQQIKDTKTINITDYNYQLTHTEKMQSEWVDNLFDD